MVHLRCCLLGLLLLVLPTRALPLNDRQEYYVDIHQYSQFFASHLSFDHLDGTVSTLSKRISQHFQSLVQVTTQPIGLNDDSFVDVDLLKGQLQGAVGCKYTSC
jgi:CTP-dependent riboflavin kinase